LFEALINLTDNLLTQINAETLFKKGLITNANEIKLQLVISSRKLKLKQGYKSKSPNEGKRYTDMLKEWFKDEKQFITEITPLINSESDIDYMKGEVTFHFYPQGETGYFEVEKNNSKRRYTPEKVFDLELKNWELAIDNAPTKKDKLQVANKAIFKLRKDYLDDTHPVIEPLKEKVIKHLQHIIEYINNSFEDSPTPQQSEVINDTKEKIQPPNNDEYNIFFELTGLNRDSTLKQTFINIEMLNPPDSTNPVMYHIPEVLKRRNITPKYAADLIDRLKSCQKKSIVENIVLPIIGYLRNNETELTISKADEVKQPNINEDIEKTLFDYSNTKNYFFSDKIETFKAIETEFVSKQYVNEKGKWQKEKMTLVAFIYIIVQLGYVRPKITGKEKRASLNAYRRFFEDRYKTNIKAQMKPSKFKIGTLKTYKPDFSFITGIDNL
jgi:hypothetical protein